MWKSWNSPGQDVLMTGTKEELDRRIEENKKRDMILVSEPTPVKNIYIHHRYSYSTLHKREFQGKDYDVHEKWVCKMRKIPKKNDNL